MPDLSLSDPPVLLTEVRIDCLPWNYLTAAFGDILDLTKSPSRILMALPAEGQPARIASISSETLRDPQATADFITRLDVPGPLTSPRLFLGPATARPPNDGTNAPSFAPELRAAPWANLSPRPFDRALVIIDAGIAFWNARFRDPTGPRFRGMRYLDFEAPDAGFGNGLDEAEIGALCAFADTQGNRAMVDRLGTDFPNSVFGKAANPNPEGFWHGTAVADLAAGSSGAEAENVALFGLELPRAVIADYSGEMLTAMLATILPAAIEMTKAFANLPLTIVMPMGFPAGPQDGTHPAVDAILAAIQMSGRSNIRIVLPAGNHLQDRCRARIGGKGNPSTVFWDLPPDDFSTNEVELHAPAGRPVLLRIAAPGQAQAVDASLPQPRSYRFLQRGGQRIGILMRFDDHRGWSRTRLSLWQTATGDGTLSPTPAGRWALVNAGSDPLDLWLFRDDRDPAADRSRPRRPSRFWSADYILRDPLGAPPLTDDPGAAVMRSGTLSVLSTTISPSIDVVQADQRLGQGTASQAAYSGRPADGRNVALSELVDDGWPDRGVPAAANGGQRRVRMSGTSAAAGLRARTLLGLGPAPQV